VGPLALGVDSASRNEPARSAAENAGAAVRIRYKLILAIGTPLLALLLLMAVFDFFVLSKRAKEATRERLAALAQRYAAEFDGRLRGLAALAKSTAGIVELDDDPATIDYFALLRANVLTDPLAFGSAVALKVDAVPGLAGAPRRPRGGDLLQDSAQPGGGVDGQTIEGLFGPYVFRGGGTDGRLRWLDLAARYDFTQPRWAWFAEPARTGEAGWTEPYLDEGGGNVPMVTFSAPIRRAVPAGARVAGEAGAGGAAEVRFAGVATVDVSLDALREEVLRQTPPGIDLWVVSRSGRVILAPNAEDQLRESLSDLSAAFNSPEFDAFAKQVRSGEPGASTLFYPPDGRTYAVFTARVGSSGWTLVGAIDEAVVLRPLYLLLAQRAAVGLGVGAVILAVVLGMGVWIVSPIRRLAEAVRGLSVDMLGQGTGPLERVAAESPGDEVGDLSRAFGTMVAQLREQVRQLTDQTRAREAVESELRLARSIQASLLPTQFVDREDVRLHAVSVPAKFVGGDFFDYLFSSDGRLWVVVADVSGKGVPAAMFMAVTRTILRDLMTRGEGGGPGEVMTRANQLLMDANHESMFVTCFVARIDPASGLIEYANAGHPPPLVVREDGSSQRLGTSTGTVLGVVEGQRYEQHAGTLPRGQRLVAYTDGVSEATTPATGTGARNGRAMFGEDGLAALCDRLARGPALTPEEFCREVYRVVDEYQAGVLHDDVTVLVVERG
jgi:sigma-B regulation protein RsbU (phosphoserine phosphatase)